MGRDCRHESARISNPCQFTIHHSLFITASHPRRMNYANAILLFFAATLAGVMNSVAGGGSFISFPTLIFTGVLPIPANATSTVALWPGSVASIGAYWRKLPRNARLLVPLTLVSVLGG